MRVVMVAPPLLTVLSLLAACGNAQPSSAPASTPAQGAVSLASAAPNPAVPNTSAASNVSSAPNALGMVRVAVGPVPGPKVNVPTLTNPYANDPVAMLAGRRLFMQMNCAGCHGDHAGGGMGPSLRDPDWIYGSGDGQIFDSIAHGRANGMPAWGVRLPEGQIWLLVTYIKALATRNEPDPPTD